MQRRLLTRRLRRYNLCFSTCLGMAPPRGGGSMAGVARKFGAAQLTLKDGVVPRLVDSLHVTPNGAMFVPPAVKPGVLPRMLSEVRRACMCASLRAALLTQLALDSGHAHHGQGCAQVGSSHGAGAAAQLDCAPARPQAHRQRHIRCDDACIAALPCWLLTRPDGCRLHRCQLFRAHATCGPGRRDRVQRARHAGARHQPRQGQPRVACRGALARTRS